jgi:putative hemolysin
MSAALLLVGLLLAIGLSGLSSGAETGIYSVDRVRLRVAGEQRQSAALRLERLMRRPEDLVITALLGTNIADYLATACMAALLLDAGISENLTEIYATAIVTPLILVFGGIVPKDWFRRESNRLLLSLSWLLLLGVRLSQATGVVWALRSLTHFLLGRIDPRHAGAATELLPRARTLHLLREGAARGRLTHLQRDVIERVLNLSGVRVMDVMIPRNRAATVPAGITRDDFLRIARMAHFSRLPVYDGNPRRIVGIVNVYNVLTDAEQRPVAEHVSPPITLPQQLSVSLALLRLQRARRTMAIVEDRSGNCVGILTLKDLVEEIVGDLEAW